MASERARRGFSIDSSLGFSAVVAVVEQKTFETSPRGGVVWCGVVLCVILRVIRTYAPRFTLEVSVRSGIVGIDWRGISGYQAGKQGAKMCVCVC